MWRKEYSQIRPHSSLGYRPPVPETVLAGTTGEQVVPLSPAGFLIGLSEENPEGKETV